MPLLGTMGGRLNKFRGGFGGVFSASGGVQSTFGAYTIHTFTANSTFTVSSGGTVEYLIVGGGGGGGGGLGGGGGGGGIVAGTCDLTPGSYSVVVGLGGAGGRYSPNVLGSSGQNSTFNSLVALGGGYAGGYESTVQGIALSGGCGGGGTTGIGGAAAGSQGFRGGNSTGWSGVYGAGGGGGGGGIGTDGTASGPGNGGIGFLSSITGVSTYYAGGGGGGTYIGGANGIGGLGGGGNAPTGNGAPNTGGGGGGQRDNSTVAAGSGGSGIVIIRYTVSLNVLSVLNGLVGWYDGASWTGTRWTDKSGSGNHATTIRGTIGTSINPRGRIVLTGATTAGIQFPVGILPATYTLFHVARFADGTRQRIFNGVTSNWLSGFYWNWTGVAFHNGWMTPQVDLHAYNWVISTDQNNLYRSNGVLRGSSGAGAPSYDQLSINYGNYGEYSDWAVSEVLVYNRTLTAQEIASVESYLFQQSREFLDRLLTDKVTQGGTWYAVKYMYDTVATPVESPGHVTTNYYIGQETLKILVTLATDMLFREDSSNTLAVFASTSAFNAVKTNILNGGSWFYNTHGGSTLAGWLVGVDGKNIPDAQQSGCNSYQPTSAWTTVFNSCGNGNGSHTSLDSTIRMRGDGYTIPKIHSIWFKIP